MSDNGFFKELPIAAMGPIAHSPTSQDPIIGIDLGTTNSLVAIVKREPAGQAAGTPFVIPSRESKNLVPSVVHFNRDGSTEVGFAAKQKRVSDPKHTVYSAKRLLGRGQADIATLKSALSFDLDHASDANIKIRIDERSYTPIEISAMILAELKAAAEEHLGRPVEDAVITVPAYFNDSQRQATRAAGRLAGLNVLRILNEPTAASLAYGLQKKKNGLIAVYDLGGGTFDISILRLRDGIFEVLATNGDTQLGGDDLDQAIVGWIETTLAKKGGLAHASLLEAAERLKISLSTQESATIEISGEKITLDQRTLQRIVMPVLNRTHAPVINALKDAGLSATELTDVVLVGGPTRLPVIREDVERLFGKKPNWSMHPDEVVAQGAAIQADILAGNNKEFLLLDVVPLSLGMETLGGGMTKLIPRNTRIPAIVKEPFTTSVDGQTKVAVNIYQGERELVSDNRKLAELILSGIPPLPAGAARVEVTFLVDADGILSVAAREIHSGVEASIEVKPHYGLTDDEVERMLAASLSHASEDRYKAALIEAKNEAKRIMLATEKALAQVGNALPPEDLSSVKTLMHALSAQLVGQDLAALKSAHEALNKGTARLAEILMEQTLQNDMKNRAVGDILKKN